MLTGSKTSKSSTLQPPAGHCLVHFMNGIICLYNRYILEPVQEEKLLTAYVKCYLDLEGRPQHVDNGSNGIL